MYFLWWKPNVKRFNLLGPYNVYLFKWIYFGSLNYLQVLVLVKRLHSILIYINLFWLVIV